MTIDEARITLEQVQVTFLEMHTPPSTEASTLFAAHLELLPKPISVEQYRSLYYGVGKQWYWLDRMVMPDEQLHQKINASHVEIFVFKVDDQPAGFAEFVKETDYVEILYFGLLPSFIGKGYGQYFLQSVIKQAWSYQPEYIQLNTCSLDHPNALNVYKKAGFREMKTTTEERRVMR